MSPLLPRGILFANPARLLVKLSPSGARIGFLAPLDAALNVWVAPTDHPERAEALTREADRSIRLYRWAYTDRHVLYIQDRAGDENWRLYSVDVEDGTARPLTPDVGAQVRFQHLSPRVPGGLLVGTNERSPRLHDLYRIDIATGERALVYENPGFVRLLADDELRVRVAVRMTDGGELEVLARVNPSAGWTTLANVPAEDALTTYPVGLDAEGATLYLVDSRGRDTSALYAVDLETRRCGRTFALSAPGSVATSTW